MYPVDAVSILYYLGYAGRTKDGCTFLSADYHQVAVAADIQSDTGSAPYVSSQNVEITEHMAVDVLRFCEIFGFPELFLDICHTLAFLGMFHVIAYKDMEVYFSIKRNVFCYRTEPSLAHSLQEPEGSPEEMDHKKITFRIKGNVTNEGSNAKFIGA